ncbi:unnamed protein product [Prorocentrum cordatum]|uniref:Uncharacterized protein n=1 Tax=Prorocentrum cordatum TaxID=2364126 RepID=A0ABN9SFY4_9DINO|nr:unnamed protein product [Polarella glacialis]
MPTTSMPRQPALRQPAAKHTLTALPKSAATFDEHGAGFGSPLCREWRDDTGQTYHIRCGTIRPRCVPIGAPHRPDAAQRWTCTFRAEAGYCKTFVLTPDEPSGKIWWGFGKSFYCVVGAVARSGVLRWYQPSSMIASFVWRAKPVEDKRTARERPAPLSSSVGARSLARTGPTVRPKWLPKEVSTRLGDEPCQRLVGQAAESSNGDGEKKAAEDEALEVVDAPPRPADTDCSQEHGPVDEPRSRAELSEKTEAKDEALKATDAPSRSAVTNCSKERGLVDAPCSRAELPSALRHLLEQMASTRKHLEEGRIQAPQEPRSPPAVDARQQVYPSLCCGSDGSSTEEGIPLPVEPAPPAEVIQTSRAIIELQEGFRTPPGLAAPPGMPWVGHGRGAAWAHPAAGIRRFPPRADRAPAPMPKGGPDDETRARSDSSCTDEAAEPPGPAGRQEPAQAAPAGGKAGEAQGEVQELTITLGSRFDDALGSLLRLSSHKLVNIDDCIIEVNRQRGLAAKPIAQPCQLQVEDVVIGQKAPHDPQQARCCAGSLLHVSDRPPLLSPPRRLGPWLRRRAARRWRRVREEHVFVEILAS